jgi:hypothetical protein
MAGLGTHAQGYMGIAFEATYGTYVPPTRFFPIRSEGLVEAFENQQRRVIRGIADNLGHIAGFSHVEGDITLELMSDVLAYFLQVSRNTVTKTGSTPNFIYTTTPAHYGSSSALPTGKKGLSITIVKNGEVFGFVGCIVSSLEIGIDSGIPTLRVSLFGRAEAVASVPTPTFLTTDVPYGAGMYTIEIPTASQVFDVASFTFTMNDNAEAQNRLINNRFAQWVKFGQREVQLQTERDFTSRAELDAFKALTAQSVTLTIARNTNDSVSVKLPAAVRDTYEIDGLSDQAAATMMRTTFVGNYDPATSKSYELTVKCATDIT